MLPLQLFAAIIALLFSMMFANGGGTFPGPGIGPFPGSSPPIDSPPDFPTPVESPADLPTPPQPPTPAVSEPKVSGIIAQGLQAPWGLAFLPEGDALVSERDSGRIVRITTSGQVSPVGTVPGVAAAGEGGLLGLAVSPRFRQDRALYAYFTAASDNRIVRMNYQDGRLGKPQAIVTGIPKSNIHNGGRLAFGPDDMLYAGTGEAGQPGLSQDTRSLGGKILRMTPEGRPAPGNPFPNSLVYSYGHRNVQGLAFDSAGRLWAAEFGQNTWDELNLIRAGGNYGWPRAEGKAGGEGYVDPLVQWSTDDASPSGIAIADDVVYMAGLRGARLWRVPIDGNRAGDPKAFFSNDYGRLRTVALAPDGSLWLITSNTDGRGAPKPGDDKILRLTLR